MNAMHGGKREGAGRPATVKTATVRVPEAGAAAARQIVEALVQYAQDALMLTRWYRTAPAEFKIGRPDVEITGIECRNRHGGMAGHDVRAVVATTTVGPYRVKFSADLDGIHEWPAVASEAVIETEEEA